MSVATNQDSPYRKLLRWEVFNFMSIEHGICEFDERNIINIKGYNDSGKSAMLRALDVLMSNIKPTKQVEFIQDDKTSFRIVAYFEDGYVIMRDKYINGNSLYEMYKDGECIFTTKQNNALTKVSEVPEQIKRFLGLISYNDIVLNSRSCFEKQLGVQTTGAENYKLFNTVLKSEEIASASTMINNDKNKLLTDITAKDNELRANKELTLIGAQLTENMINFLQEHDKLVDTYEVEESKVIELSTYNEQLDNIVIYPEISKVDASRLDAISGIDTMQQQLASIQIYPEINPIDMQQLNLLANISAIIGSLDSIVDYPELGSITSDRLDALGNIFNLMSMLDICDTNLSQIEEQLQNNDNIMLTLSKELTQAGVKMVKCPGCGKIFSADEHHID